MAWRGEQDIRDVIESGKPFVDQVEAWAKVNTIELPKHWKVDLALETKKRALQRGITVFDEETISRWRKLFSSFIPSRNA